MARKLTDLKHAVIHDDQEPVQNAIDRLQRVRDDLLSGDVSERREEMKSFRLGRRAIVPPGMLLVRRAWRSGIGIR